MKIAIVGNQARAMSNFWTVLIQLLISRGHQVICLVPLPGPDDDIAWEVALLDLGVQLIRYPLDRKGLNVRHDLRTCRSLFRILRRQKPDILFCFTIKPVIYGALASFFAGMPAKKNRFCMITGLGYVFEADTGLKKILFWFARMLYSLALRCMGTVFFQNEDDARLFSELGILPKGCNVAMSKGTGVDTERFFFSPSPTTPLRFLFVGRLLEAKGLHDLYLAAKEIKNRHPEITVSVLGPAEHGPGALPLEEVLRWQEEGVITYCGETHDVRPFLSEAGVVVLPSWREGTPCSLMEAMSMGKAVIAADVPGSREVVREGQNGFLVPVKSPEALAAAMERFIEHPALIQQMGEAGRRMATTEFDAYMVASSLLARFEGKEAEHD